MHAGDALNSRAFLIKAESRVFHRDTTSHSLLYDPLRLENISDAAMANVTNASLLAAYYTARHQRYRGVGSPVWGAGSKIATVWPNGYKSPSVKIDDVGEAFELMTSPVSAQARTAGGEGSVWHGVDTLMSPLDAAAFSAMLWEHRPMLLVEIGTECGGSAIFFASIMREWGGRVLTYDVRPTWHRCGKTHESGRRMLKGYKSRVWAQLVANGSLEARIADVSSAIEQARVARYAAAATGSVWIFDDGDHFTTPLLVHFHLLARHVTPGGYYLVADTRLERTCRSAWLAVRIRTDYCLKVLTLEGGPGRAVHYLQKHHPQFKSNGVASEFQIDRTPERWLLTQHPGGWIRRRRST